MAIDRVASANEQVCLLLGAAIPDKLLSELLDNHGLLKTAFFCGDWEKCLLRGGKLAETVMKIVHFARTQNIVSSIKVDDEIHQAEKSSLPDELRMLVPRHVRALYDHRTKRGGAHGSFDANPLDATVVVALSDWLVGELIRIYGEADPASALRLCDALTRRLIPLVEEIDGELLVHKSRASCREELRLMLYSRYPERTSRGQLRVRAKNHNSSAVGMALRRMEKDKEIHANSEGLLLTAAGREKAEEMMRQSLP